VRGGRAAEERRVRERRGGLRKVRLRERWGGLRKVRLRERWKAPRKVCLFGAYGFTPCYSAESEFFTEMHEQPGVDP